MPDYSASLANFRKGGHKLRGYASFFVGDLVYASTVALVTSYPMVALLIASAEPTYDHADIKAGFRVDILTAGGVLKGRTRVRYGNSITDTVIPIRETSKAALEIVVGDIVRIYADPRLSDKLPEANELFSPDGAPWATYGAAPPPVANSGGVWVGKSSMLPALMTGSTSFTIDPASGGTMTHAWDSDGLTYAGGTLSTDADVQLTGAAGAYLVAHTVTDDDNSASITKYTPVIIDDTPYKVVVEDLPNDEQRGGTARIRMLENATLDDVPDGSLCVIWKEEYIAGTRQSFGGRAPGRAQVLYVGYVRHEEGELIGEDGTDNLTFELISPLAYLDELMGYSKVMIADAAPDDWQTVDSPLYISRAIVQLFMYYSFLIESPHDLIFSDTFVDLLYSGFYVNASTPIQQVRELAFSTLGRLVEDRRGRFEVQMIPQCVALGDRAALDTVLTLTTQDFKRLRYTREHWYPVNRLEMRAFIAGATEAVNLPIFSQYPGDAPGEGNQTTTTEKVIAADQDGLNEMCGRWGASLDGKYTDADGVTQYAYDLEVTLRGVYDLFDFYDELVSFNVQTTKRGLDLSEHAFVYVGSTISFEDGTAETVARFRTCTNAAAGTTFVPPVEELPDYTPIDTTPITLPPPVTGGSLLPVWGGVDQVPISLAVDDAGGAHFGYATSFNPVGSSITYVENSTGLAGSGLWLTFDPFNWSRAFSLRTGGVYRNNNPKGGEAWALAMADTGLFGASGRYGNDIFGSINRQGWFCIPTGTRTVVITTDYFASVSVIPIFSTADYTTSLSPAANYGVRVFVSPYNSGSVGWLYAIIYGAGSGSSYVYKSTDWGLTWTQIGTLSNSYAVLHPHIPYKRLDGSPNINDAAQELLAQGNGCLYFSDTAGVSWAALELVDLGVPSSIGPASAFWGNPIQTFTYGALRVISATMRGGAGGNYGGIRVSNDGGDTSALTQEIFSGANNMTHWNGFPVHQYAMLGWASDGSNSDLYWSLGSTPTFYHAAKPSFFSGLIANAQWMIDDI